MQHFDISTYPLEKTGTRTLGLVVACTCLFCVVWGPFRAILSDLSTVRTTQNRQVHAKQEVGQLYFIIHNNIIYF